MNAWLSELEMLAARSPQLGIGPDLADMEPADLYGLLLFLRRSILETS